MVIFGEWAMPPLRTLERRLVDNNIADPISIKVLDKASVPIIKLTDTLTKIKLDISFNTNNCLKSAEKIKVSVVKMTVYELRPQIRYLITLLE